MLHPMPHQSGPGEPIVEIKSVTCGYEKQRVLTDVRLHIMPGDVVGEIHLVLARQGRLERRRHQLGCQRVHCGRIETAVLDNRT